MGKKVLLLVGAAVVVILFQNCGGGFDSMVSQNDLSSENINNPPFVSAGADLSIFAPGNNVMISAMASDSDGVVNAIQWMQISGPSQATLAGESTQNLNVSNLMLGTYVFRIVAVDDSGNSSFDEVSVVVNAAGNVLPMVNAGSDRTIQLPVSSVGLMGTATDSDGSIASLMWSQVSGPSTAILVGDNTLTPSASSLVQGTYVFQLRATDNMGGVSVDAVQVIVQAAAMNVLPLVNAGADKSIQLPTSISTLAGMATDSDGTIASLVWSQVSGPNAAVITTPTALNSNLSGLTQGTYVFQLRATDNQGGVGTDSISIVVNAAANALPMVNAGADLSIQLPISSVSMTGVATDSNGTIAGVMWSQVSGPNTAMIAIATSLTTNISGLAQGSYEFQLQATDNQGGVSLDRVRVEVRAAPVVNVVPVVSAGVDRVVQLPATTTALVGTATDSDGTIASSNWSQVSGPNTAVIATPNALNTNVSGLVQGIYQMRFRATDNAGGVSEDLVQIEVRSAPSANMLPIVSAGMNRSIQLPVSSAGLLGTATDSDGTIASVLWSQVSGPNTALLSTPTTLSTNVSGLIVGAYVFQLRATDNLGAQAVHSVQVTVTSALPNCIGSPAGTNTNAANVLYDVNKIRRNFPVASTTGFSCPTAPRPPSRFDPPSSNLPDGSIDPAYTAHIKPFNDYVNKISEFADLYLQSQDQVVADCALTWLTAWTNTTTFQENVGNGSLNYSTTQGDYDRTAIFGVILMNIAKIQGSNAPNKTSRINSIYTWMNPGMVGLLNFHNNRVTYNATANTIGRPQNLNTAHGWAAYTVLMYGILRANNTHITWANNQYRHIVNSIQTNGLIPGDLTANNRAYMQHHHHLRALVLIAEMNMIRGTNLYTYNSNRLNRSINLITSSHTNPTAFTSLVTVPQNHTPQSLITNLPLYLDWMEIYHSRFNSANMAPLIKTARANSRNGRLSDYRTGDMTGAWGVADCQLP